jgi:hypothetical protein
MENVGIFYGHLEYSTAIWSILRPLGKVGEIWYVLPRFGILFQEKSGNPDAHSCFRRTCILSGGSPYSYCGVHEHDVCCLVPENAEPVGILPTPKSSRCGKKGKDTGKDGEAEMAEWPWHVSCFIILFFSCTYVQTMTIHFKL